MDICRHVNCVCACDDIIVCKPSNVSVMTWMFADMYTVCVCHDMIVCGPCNVSVMTYVQTADG